jgi:hypothetical protein
MVETEVPAAGLRLSFLSDMTESHMLEWMKKALEGNLSPLILPPGDYPSTELASIPRELKGDTLSRYRTVLTLLLKEFAEDLSSWNAEASDELIALAGLLGSSALPGRDPWDLGLSFSLAPLVDHRAQWFDESFPEDRRLRILALLAGGSELFGSTFWKGIGLRRVEYRCVAWRGMLRDADWSEACAWMAVLPDDERSLETLRYYIRYAALRILRDEAGVLRRNMQNALPKVRERVKILVIEEAAKVGVDLRKREEAPPKIMRALGRWLEDAVQSQALKPATVLHLKSAMDFAARQGDLESPIEAVGFAENYLRTRCAQDSEELRIVEGNQRDRLNAVKTGYVPSRIAQQSVLAEA